MSLTRHVFDASRCRFCDVNDLDADLYEADCVEREPMTYTSETFTYDRLAAWKLTSAQIAELTGYDGRLYAVRTIIGVIHGQVISILDRGPSDISGSFDDAALFMFSFNDASACAVLGVDRAALPGEVRRIMDAIAAEVGVCTSAG